MPEVATSVTGVNYNALNPAVRRKLTESHKEFIDFYAQKLFECRGLNIAHFMSYFSGNDIKVMRSFVDKWGLENAKGILSIAFGHKYQGQYRDIIIGQNLFIAPFDWMAKMFLNEYLQEVKSSPATDAVASDVGFRINYL